jgi:hypothetical protein
MAGEWSVSLLSSDWVGLRNTTGEDAGDIVVRFFRPGMRRPRETVVINPPVLAAGAATRIHLVELADLETVEVSWRAVRGRTRRWKSILPRPHAAADRPASSVPDRAVGAGRAAAAATSGELSYRLSVLPIDRSTTLPLQYVYDAEQQQFSTAGYVRARGMMVPHLEHRAPDTSAGRDEFLHQLLAALLVPARQARRTVRRAHHG